MESNVGCKTEFASYFEPPHENKVRLLYLPEYGGWVGGFNDASNRVRLGVLAFPEVELSPTSEGGKRKKP